MSLDIGATSKIIGALKKVFPQRSLIVFIKSTFYVRSNHACKVELSRLSFTLVNIMPTWQVLISLVYNWSFHQMVELSWQWHVNRELKGKSKKSRACFTCFITMCLSNTEHYYYIQPHLDVPPWLLFLKKDLLFKSILISSLLRNQGSCYFRNWADTPPSLVVNRTSIWVIKQSLLENTMEEFVTNDKLLQTRAHQTDKLKMFTPFQVLQRVSHCDLRRARSKGQLNHFKWHVAIAMFQWH